MNTTWSVEELEEKLPALMKHTLAEKHIKFYIVNAVKIAQEIGLGGRFNMIMQSAFFKLAAIIPMEEAVKYLKDSVEKDYGAKGQNVVDMNNAAIDKGIADDTLIEVKVPAEWAEAKDEAADESQLPEFVSRIQNPMLRQEGDKLPVSLFSQGMEDGTFPTGGAAYEKRGTAIMVPEWQVENCIQCTQCSFICPHAAIRPILLSAEEKAKAPAAMKSKAAIGVKDMDFTIAVSPLDCVGCGNCADVCPGMRGRRPSS